MTQLLYFDSDALTGQAIVLACNPGTDGHEIILDGTLFHPQGGGQPCDVGRIGQAQVHKVMTRQGAVVHCVDKDVALGPVCLQVDAETRGLHARLHSAGHLIGHALVRLGWKGIRAHHWPGDARVMVAPAGQGEPLTVERVKSEVDDLIDQNLPRFLMQLGDRREVGFGELPPFACGGTHVKFTQDVGRCVIENISQGKDGQWIRYAVA